MSPTGKVDGTDAARCLVRYETDGTTSLDIARMLVYTIQELGTVPLVWRDSC
jgi:hypothetical protein